MCSILMSIKPEYVEKILSGNKKYEFRKSVCKRFVDKIYIYSTFPVKMVVGEAEVECILIEKPEELWKMTKEDAGINKEFFDEYFENKDKAVAYKLNNIRKYKKPKKLIELGVKVAPQSYQYVEQ